MKTPKEKAKELIKQFEPLFKDLYLEEYITKKCKKSALICVNEILKDNPNIYDSDRLNHKYWNEVKNYLERL